MIKQRIVFEFARGVSVSQTKLPVRGGMTVRAYPVLWRAVEEGVQYGWRRAHKHTNTPDENYIEQQIVDAVLHEICEYFYFSDSEVEK
jgi:hypothetical protein